MCCEPIRTASGQTCGVVTWLANQRFLVLTVFSFDTKTPAPGPNTDSCTGRAVHSGWTPGWNWHKMQALPCRTRGLYWRSARPFIVALLFLSLAGLLDWTETPGVGGSSRKKKLNQHICVFSHQCEIVQYDGCLMLKQDWYYDLGRVFSYRYFHTFIPSSIDLQST